VRWETFTSRYDKYTQKNTYQTLSESASFCKRYDKNILVCLWFTVSTAVHLENANAKFHKVTYIETLFRRDEKRLHYCMTNSLATTREILLESAEFYKRYDKIHFGAFSVHSVYDSHMGLNGFGCGLYA